ncbi:MAG: hypothetical protein FJW35_13285 [Acidobacteria bacterium]|nr:hypothetical protein [Acidobacteriota bacterium]
MFRFMLGSTALFACAWLAGPAAAAEPPQSGKPKVYTSVDMEGVARIDSRSIRYAGTDMPDISDFMNFVTHYSFDLEP